MSLFDNIFGSSDDNESVGEDVLSAYYNEAKKFPEFTYTTIESWFNYLNSKVPDFVKNTGELVNMNSAGTTVEEAQMRMIDLANKSGGTANVASLTMAAGGKGESVNWTKALPEIAKESVKDVVETVQNVGSGTLSTLNLMKYLPWILGGAGALYIVFLAKGTGKGLGSILGSKISKNPRKRRRK